MVEDHLKSGYIGTIWNPTFKKSRFWMVGFQIPTVITHTCNTYFRMTNRRKFELNASFEFKIKRPVQSSSELRTTKYWKHLNIGLLSIWNSDAIQIPVCSPIYETLLEDQTRSDQKCPKSQEEEDNYSDHLNTEQLNTGFIWILDFLVSGIQMVERFEIRSGFQMVVHKNGNYAS